MNSYKLRTVSLEIINPNFIILTKKVKISNFELQTCLISEMKAENI